MNRCPECKLLGAHLPTCKLNSSSSYAEEARRRYRDGYTVARTTNVYGALIKVLGIALGMIVAVVGYFVGAQISTLTGVGVVLAGFALAIPLYGVGVLVSAQAQMAMAVLDTAVHTSPFLDDHGKAAAMSLD